MQAATLQGVISSGILYAVVHEGLAERSIRILQMYASPFPHLPHSATATPSAMARFWCSRHLCTGVNRVRLFAGSELNGSLLSYAQCNKARGVECATAHMHVFCLAVASPLPVFVCMHRAVTLLLFASPDCLNIPHARALPNACHHFQWSGHF